MGCRCLLGTLVWCGFDEVWESTVWLCFVFFLFASTPLVASCSCARAGVCRVVPPAPPAAGYRERAAAPDETGARVAPQRNVHHGGGGTGRALLATRGGGVVAGADLGPVDHIPDGRQVGHLVVLVLQVKRVLSGEKRAGSQGTDGREAGRKQQRDRRRTAGWRKTREGTGGCPRGQSASQPRWRPQPAATAVGCHRAAPTR